MIVDVISVNSVMGTEGWERGERGKSQGGGSSCYPTGDQSGWEFITTSKKLAFQVSGNSLLFARGFNERLLVHCVNIKMCMSCKYK